MALELLQIKKEERESEDHLNPVENTTFDCGGSPQAEILQIKKETADSAGHQETMGSSAALLTDGGPCRRDCDLSRLGLQYKNPMGPEAKISSDRAWELFQGTGVLLEPVQHKSLTDSGTGYSDCATSLKVVSLICNKCGVSFSGSGDLMPHQCNHSLINGHILWQHQPGAPLCTESETRNSSENSSRSQQLLQTVEKWFPCPECGKVFNGRSGLNKHIIIHSEEKPFSCTECGKTFLRKLSLVEHERIHTGEKPFTCSQCGRSFSRRSGLYKHEVICNEEKPFSCTVCSKRFSQKTLCLIHQNSHTPPCPDCGKIFDKKCNFLKHIQIHKKPANRVAKKILP